jgi:hypothetical protein
MSEDQPISQEKNRTHRKRWSAWRKQMPRLRFPPPNNDFRIIDDATLIRYLRTIGDKDAALRIRADIEHLNQELLPLFRQRDYEAKLQQNRYRLFQISYILLAALATLLGGLLGLSISSNPLLVPFLAFCETLVSLLTVFLATISGREPPMQLWMSNRKCAEMLRQEYFRYLANLEPYDTATGYRRQMLLSQRAAKLNGGSLPARKVISEPK